jgi:hypothetical protein
VVLAAAAASLRAGNEIFLPPRGAPVSVTSATISSEPVNSSENLYVVTLPHRCVSCFCVWPCPSEAQSVLPTCKAVQLLL